MAKNSKTNKPKVEGVDPKFVETDKIYEKNGKKLGRYRGRLFEIINQNYGMWADTGDVFLLSNLK